MGRYLSALDRFIKVESCLISCLDIEWKKEWFPNIFSYPRSYWKSMENRKLFLDELAVKLNVKEPRDWGKIPRNRIYEFGGASLLTNYYNSSVFNCIRSVYKGLYLLEQLSEYRY